MKEIEIGSRLLTAREPSYTSIVRDGYPFD
jgi:hypothetical protein